MIESLQIELHGDFSIVNVSKVPLQKAAYKKNNVNVPKNIELLEKIKRLIDQGAELDTKHRFEELNTLKMQIYKSFKSECEANLKGHKVLIPCGRFARTFCKKLNNDSNILNFTLIEDIPHPSSGWSSLDQEEIDQIKSYIK